MIACTMRAASRGSPPSWRTSPRPIIVAIAAPSTSATASSPIVAPNASRYTRFDASAAAAPL